jgi:diaminopimelate decarboxylase
MSERTIPVSRERLAEIAERFPTPFYLYDEAAIRENARRLKQSFSICEGFREYFAVKALPNPYILKILADEGFGADCSSLPELILSEKSGITGEMIMFSSNETPAAEYRYAHKLGAVLNLDDYTHIDFLRETLGALPELISFRYNPGPLKEGNAIIGVPEEAKYGLTRPQIIDGYRKVREMGVKRFGLHTMVASNELNSAYFVETARLLYELALEVHNTLGIRIEFINIGGGIGIPYKPGDRAVDYDFVARGAKAAYDELIVPAGLAPMKLFMECGRIITGPYGYLVTQAIHEKHIYREYIGVNASMADLMRPGMYGAYHEITVPGKEKEPKTQVYDVVGSLCENCDKFAVQRHLPKIEKGDFVVIHDSGAHGRAMGFNYNAKLRCGELLLRTDGSVIQIRRPETIEDYFAALDFAGLDAFVPKV